MNKRGKKRKSDRKRKSVSKMNKRGEVNMDNRLTDDIEKLILNEKEKTLKKAKKKRIFEIIIIFILIFLFSFILIFSIGKFISNNMNNNPINGTNNNFIYYSPGNNTEFPMNDNPSLNISNENNSANKSKTNSRSGGSSGGGSSGGSSGTTCTPDINCNSYPGYCGTSLTDNCNNALDCRNTCVPICDAQPGSNCYYISATGNDSNNGSYENPWNSFNHNNSQLKPGDIVYVMSGIYNKQEKVLASGNSSGLISFEAYPYEHPIIDGTGIILSWAGLIQISNKSYIKIQGFTIRNARNNTIAGIFVLDNSHDIEILNNTISNTSMSGILIGEGSTSADELNSNITVKYNEIFDTNHKLSQEALSICNVNNFEIAFNHVHDTFKEGIDIKCSSSNGTVHNNIVHNIPGSEIYLDANPIYNISIYSNYLYDEEWNGPGEGDTWPGFYRWTPGISLNSEHGSTMDYVMVYNNIVDNVSYFSFTIENSNHLPNTKIRHVKVFNNDFERSYASGGDNIMITAWANNTEDIEIMNNILWRRIQYDSWGNAIGSVENITEYDVDIHNNLYEYYWSWNNVTGKYDGPFYGYNNTLLGQGKNVSFILGQDPILGNVETYKVNSSSETIDNGSVVDLNVDYFGNPRPQGNGYDIGAYEF